jgi:hypothetical protein
MTRFKRLNDKGSSLFHGNRYIIRARGQYPVNRFEARPIVVMYIKITIWGTNVPTAIHIKYATLAWTGNGLILY